MTSLRKKLVSQGLSLGAISRATGVNKADVSRFVSGQISKTMRSSRKMLRRYFIEAGFLPRPKPRKPTVCRQCGCEYPTRTESNQPQSSSQA